MHSKPKARRLRRAWPESVLIKPAAGKKYADVLKLGATKDVEAKFSEALCAAVDEDGQMRQLVPRAKLDIRDLDLKTGEQEVRDALETFFGQEKAMLLRHARRKTGA